MISRALLHTNRRWSHLARIPASASTARALRQSSVLTVGSCPFARKKATGLFTGGDFQNSYQLLELFLRPRDQCLPFTIENRGVKGNVIVAARDIRPFETIIIDRPAIIGPFDDTLPECLECFKEVSIDGYKVS